MILEYSWSYRCFPSKDFLLWSLHDILLLRYLPCVRASRTCGMRREEKWTHWIQKTLVSSGGCPECCSRQHWALWLCSLSASFVVRSAARRVRVARRPPASTAPRAHPPALPTRPVCPLRANLMCRTVCYHPYCLQASVPLSRESKLMVIAEPVGQAQQMITLRGREGFRCSRLASHIWKILLD